MYCIVNAFRTHVTSFILDDGTGSDKLYVFGGYNFFLTPTSATDTADLYDDATKTFRFKPCGRQRFPR